MKTFLIILLIIAAALALFVPLAAVHGRKSKSAGGARVKISVLALSAACIVLCAAMSGGSTYAWFTDGVSSASDISPASFSVAAELDGVPLAVSGTSGTYQARLAAGASYTLDLTAEGTASTGYAVIILNDSTVYTQQLSAADGDSMTLTLVINQDAAMTVTPCWGSYSGSGLVFYSGSSCTYG